jgi:hypothetical protein
VTDRNGFFGYPLDLEIHSRKPLAELFTRLDFARVNLSLDDAFQIGF